MTASYDSSSAEEIHIDGLSSESSNASILSSSNSDEESDLTSIDTDDELEEDTYNYKNKINMLIHTFTSANRIRIVKH